MQRVALILLLSLGLIAPAQAVEMLLLPITAASASVSQSFQVRPGPGGQFLPSQMTLQATFAYGSGGTTTDAYIQTSLDGGVTWADVANFHFTTANARTILNASSATSITTAVAATDGALAANTATVGIYGTLWRVKYVTVGTYAGNTSLRIDAITSGLTSLP